MVRWSLSRCASLQVENKYSNLQIVLEPKAPQDNAVILHMLKCELLRKSNATVLHDKLDANGVKCLHPALTHSFAVMSLQTGPQDSNQSIVSRLLDLCALL